MPLAPPALPLRAVRLTVVAALAIASIGASPTAPIKDAQAPLDAAIDAVAPCDTLDERLCLLPFPNDGFTTLDDSTPTGRRVAMHPLTAPRNLAGKPVDLTEWNRNDGFSPGAMVLTVVPGLDLTVTLGLDETPETGPFAGYDLDPFAERDAEPDALIEDPARSLAADSPLVLLNADTGERHPFFAELDEHPETLEQGDDRTLIIRPLVNLTEGHRYIVALRDLRDAEGTELEAGAEFAELRDRLAPGGGPPAWAPPCQDTRPGNGESKGNGNGPSCDDGDDGFPAPADIDPADRDARYEDIFERLDAVGVDVGELYLAWDFHVASAENLAGRVLSIRDDAFAQLGDTELWDLEIQGDSPDFTIDEVVDGESDGFPTRTVHGTVTVPNYLTHPQDGVQEPFGELPPAVVPGSRFLYAEPQPGAMAKPIQNPAFPTMEAEFTCKFRTDVGLTRPTLYGHGLLGGRGEVEGSSTGDLRRGGHAMCGVDWIGMATEDITNVALILHDFSFFPSLADRAQQGFLNFLYVGRALIHEDGVSAHPAFRDGDGAPYLDISELFYNGNSQGGIMGGALTALAPDFTKSVLGVPGMNYSTLLNRSVDWEGEFVDPDTFDPTDPEDNIPAYASFFYNMYPDKVEQQLAFALMQMMWDRAEGNGYAAHMTSDPYPNTPAHQVILEVALGDYQVTNHAAEVEARTIGADFLGTALAAGRHWERAYALGEAPTPFGLDPFAVGDDGVAYAPSGSAIVYWDSGNPLPFNGNIPPVDLHHDPHSDPRKDDRALLQKLRFYEDGVIVDVLDGAPYYTHQYPRHPGTAGS